MSRNWYLQTCGVLIFLLMTLILTVMPGNQLRAEDSSCITCHTDEDLLEENLGNSDKENLAFQAGSG